MTHGAIVSEEPALASDGRTARKRGAILTAAANVFLQAGYLGASVDEIAAASRVSKQTIYKQFSSKEALFIEVVTRLTDEASDAVHNEAPDPDAIDDVQGYLENYASRKLEIVLTPRLMQLRRMVIGEVGRFPELGRALYESGPRRAIGSIAARLAQLAARGLLDIRDANIAAAQLNWLVMGGPLNEAMLLGDGVVAEKAFLRRHAAEAVRVFLAMYAKV